MLYSNACSNLALTSLLPPLTASPALSNTSRAIANATHLQIRAYDRSDTSECRCVDETVVAFNRDGGAKGVAIAEEVALWRAIEVKNFNSAELISFAGSFWEACQYKRSEGERSGVVRTGNASAVSTNRDIVLLSRTIGEYDEGAGGGALADDVAWERRSDGRSGEEEGDQVCLHSGGGMGRFVRWRSRM